MNENSISRHTSIIVHFKLLSNVRSEACLQRKVRALRQV